VITAEDKQIIKASNVKNKYENEITIEFPFCMTMKFSITHNLCE